MKSKRIRIGQIKTNLSDTAVAKPAANVVFIHGFPFNKDIWKLQIDALPERFAGLAYDVRGHGKSTVGHGYFSIDLFARDLEQLIKGLKLKKVILCGISMGGYIALRAMELIPELISGLILCDTHSLADSNEAKANRFAQIETIMEKDKEAFAEGFIKKLFSEEAIKSNTDPVETIREAITQNKEKNICATLLALAARTDTTERLEKIRIPALVIRGADDQIITDAQAQLLHSKIKGSEIAVIPDAGHLPNLEQPQRFNKLMNDFILKNFSA